MATLRFAITGVFCWILAIAAAPVGAHPPDLCDGASLLSTQEDFLDPPDFTRFGAAVAIRDDTAMVGLPNYISPDNAPDQRGRVAVFTCDAETRTWTRTGSLDPHDQEESEFSFGAALVLQAEQAVVGAQNAVRLYDRKSSGWRAVVKLTSNGIDEFIGPVIAYERPYVVLFRTRAVGEEMSRFIEIYRVGKGIGATLVDRLPAPEGSGPLALENGTLLAGPYVYQRRGNEWRLKQRLAPAGGPAPEGFGSAVALHRGVIVLGSPLEDSVSDGEGPRDGGAVYVFERRNGVWQQVQRIRPNQGGFALFGATLAFNGAFAAIGTPGAVGGFQREFGPTFLYRLEESGLVFERTIDVIATSIGMSRRHLIAGTTTNVQGLPQTGATIIRLPDSKEAAGPKERGVDAND